MEVVRGAAAPRKSSDALILPKACKFSQVALARVVAKRLAGNGPALVYDLGRLWRYAAPSWQEVPDHELAKEIHSLDGAICEFKKYTLRVTDKLVHGTIHRLRDEVSRPGFFERAGSRRLALRSGILEFDADGKITHRAHQPEDGTRWVIPVDWDSKALCGRWTKALAEIFADEDSKEKIDVLRRWVGTALIGEATVHGRALILVGGGANGKSVILSTVAALWPKEQVAEIAPQDLHDDRARHRLASTSLVLIPELPATELLTTAELKAAITGEAAFSARALYRERYEFTPRAAWLAAANELPTTKDHSDGMWRRWILLATTGRFEGAAADPMLRSKLLEELPGIVAWAVSGAVDVVRAGHLSVPEVSTQAVDEWRRESDPVANWLSGCAFLDDYPTPATTAFIAFDTWARLNGHRSLSTTAFGRRMKALRVPWRRHQGGIFYGLDLRAAPTAPPTAPRRKR